MEERAGLPIRAFEDQAALEAWLDEQPRVDKGIWHKGIWLKLAKKGAGDRQRHPEGGGRRRALPRLDRRADQPL